MDDVTTVYDVSFIVCFAGMVARVESLRGRMGESTRGALGRARRDLEGLFESLLAQSFDGEH